MFCAKSIGLFCYEVWALRPMGWYLWVCSGGDAHPMRWAFVLSCSDPVLCVRAFFCWRSPSVHKSLEINWLLIPQARWHYSNALWCLSIWWVELVCWVALILSFILGAFFCWMWPFCTFLALNQLACLLTTRCVALFPTRDQASQHI